MAGLFTPDPRLPTAEEPDVFARVPGVAGRPDFSAMQAVPTPQFKPQLPEARARPVGPDIWTNEATGQFYVQGHVFDEDDAQSALDTEQFLSQPGSGEAPPAGWIQLDPSEYAGFLNAIKNPSMGRLAKKNFGRGVDVNQMLGGRLMQFAGAEGMGQKVVANQLEDLRKTGPYERMFTGIGEQENRGILDWFVANLAQQGPNIVESAVTAALGAVAGGAAGGGPNPFTAAGGAFMSLAGKESFKQAVLSAAKKHAAGQTLTAAETKLLREAAGITAAAQIKLASTQATKDRVKDNIFYSGAEGVLDSGAMRGKLAAEITGLEGAIAKETAGAAATVGKAGLTQARIGGAGLASLGQNYLTGVADVYGETVESGDPDRAIAAGMGIPYALLETAPEFLLAGRVFGNLGGRNRLFGTTPLKDIEGKLGKTGEMVKRAGVGFTVGGVGEGFTEAGQEGLLIGANEDLDWDSPEGLDRLINSFAAGFGVGGPIGGVGGMFGTDSKAPTNMLNPSQSPEPAAASVVITPPMPPPNVGRGPSQFPVPFTGQQPLEGELMPPGVPPGGGAGGATFLPGPSTPTSTPPGTILTGEGALPTGPGTQGVLPLFNEMPATEMAQRMGGVPTLPAALPPGGGAQPVSDTFTNPQQGALQFAPPAPGPTTDFGSAIAQALAAAQRGEEFDAARDQRRLGPEYDQALQQRELQDAEAATAPAPFLAGMPMVEGGPRTPQQMNLPMRLFRRGQPPKVSATQQRLRRGASVAAEVDLEPTSNVQLEMFTGEGAPTVAALKGAGLRRRTRPTPAGTGVPQIPPTGKKVTREDVVEARTKAEEKAGPKRGLKKQAGVAKVEEKTDAVQKRSPAKVDAREQAKAGRGMGGEVPPASEAARAIAQLRKGKAATDTGEPDRKEAIVPKNVKPPKEEAPPPKSEAAAAVSAAAAQPAPEAKAATSAKAEAPTGPVAISVELSDGRVMNVPDGKKLLDKLDRDIEKFERFLACLLGK